MSKVMLVSYRSPVPVTSGDKIRIFQNIEMLSKKHKVSCFFSNENNFNGEIPYTKNNHFVKFNKYIAPLKGIFFMLIFGWPFQVGYFFSFKLYKHIKSELVNFDLVFLNNIRTFSYFSLINTKKPIYLDFVDSMILNFNNKANTSNFILKLIFKVETLLLVNYHKKCFEKITKGFVISNKDKEDLCSRYRGINIGIYTNYISYLTFNEVILNQNIGFMGKLSYEPNVKAIKYFLNEIYPTVKLANPKLQFNIYGTSFNKKIYKKYLNLQGVNFKGFVEDIKSEIINQRFMIAPMISGSGLQNKVIEAMGLGRLVIGSEIVKTGLPLSNSFDYVSFTNNDDFISKINYYLNDGNREKLFFESKKAFDYVQDIFCKPFVIESFYSQMETN
jgi:hypothetical protein